MRPQTDGPREIRNVVRLTKSAPGGKVQAEHEIGHEKETKTDVQQRKVFQKRQRGRRKQHGSCPHSKNPGLGRKEPLLSVKEKNPKVSKSSNTKQASLVTDSIQVQCKYLWMSTKCT